RRQAWAHRLGPGEVPLRCLVRGLAREAPVRPVLRETSVNSLRPDDPVRHGKGRSLRKGCQVISNATAIVWEEQEQGQIVALNVTGRYVPSPLEMAVGLIMLPFNANHLGASGYGLWMLAASIVAYFPVLDLGLGPAMERAVAHHRAERNPEAINEVASTLV